MTATRRARVAVAAVAVAIMGLAALSMSAPVPSLWSPFPLAVVAPVIVAEELLRPSRAFLLALSVPSIAFVFFSLPLLGAAERIPRYARWFGGVLLVLSVAFFAASTSHALEYQGGVHLAVMLASNVAFVISLATVSRRNARSPSFASNLAFHALLFAWLSWCAFPWLGELI